MNLDTWLAGIPPEGEIPPLERWHPECRGDMDLTIAADGRWLHEGAVIARPALVRLLASVLRREDDGEYYLVAPAEKWRIRVEDRPLLIVDAERDAAGDWQLVTNAGDRVRLDDTHRLTVSDTPRGEAVPEVPVRFGLAARLGRNVFYRLADTAECRDDELGLESGGAWHSLGRWDDEAS
ncbi:DUF1285 domain-containing protein [Halomonas salina]|uniref:DUF1285 domain-containing protein n=1 Tax=Halomonas salina TaxID=42565 RepID=A0ABR4WQK7_9GAMM|nr:DUF1285 domain-containing protein [Halomonas salina]KGE77011.1 hypothetical protein FP66_12885 [Halomonas salina]